MSGDFVDSDEPQLRVDIKLSGFFWEATVYDPERYWRGREEHSKEFFTKRGAVRWASDHSRVRRWFNKQQDVTIDA